MAVVLAVAAAVLVTILLVVALVGLLLWKTRDRVVGWAARHLVAVAGPAIVRSMPPRAVLGALLDRVFGDTRGHEEIASALLGGGGHDVFGRDVAISRATTVSMSLNRIDHGSCLIEMTWSHEFSGVRDNHRLVMFATSNAEIFELLTRRRVYPLYESWLLSSDDQLDDYVPAFRNRLRVGITYRDADGYVHTSKPSAVVGEEVPLKDYAQFVKLPERLDRKELRIVQLDLYDFADPDHIVEAVERLTLQASTVGPFDQGFITWTAPYPCFVDTIVFDVRNLPRPSEKLVYQLIVNTNANLSLPFQLDWTHVPDEIEIPVHAWMLPGHGVTLLWRPVDGTEPAHDLEQF